MGVHEAMMDTALDLWDMDECLTVDQARALARLTKLRQVQAGAGSVLVRGRQRPCPP